MAGGREGWSGSSHVGVPVSNLFRWVCEIGHQVAVVVVAVVVAALKQQHDDECFFMLF